jgi:hypothetical protein
MPEFRAEIIKKHGGRYFLDVTADTAKEALDVVASNIPDGSYK